MRALSHGLEVWATQEFVGQPAKQGGNEYRRADMIAGGAGSASNVRVLAMSDSKVRQTCESKAGFSIWQLTKTQRWFLTMKSFTLAFLFFLWMTSPRCLQPALAASDAY